LQGYIRLSEPNAVVELHNNCYQSLHSVEIREQEHQWVAFQYYLPHRVHNETILYCDPNVHAMEIEECGGIYASIAAQGIAHNLPDSLDYCL
jgi:hypothetical protein